MLLAFHSKNNKQERSKYMKSLSMLIAAISSHQFYFGVLGIVLVLLVLMFLFKPESPEAAARRILKLEARQKLRMAQDLRCSLIDCILDELGSKRQLEVANDFEAASAMPLAEASIALRECRYTDAIRHAMEAVGFLKRGLDVLDV
jgi:hypothetical protein